MSGSGSGSGQPANPAEAEFARYKARMSGAAPMMMPVMMPPGAMPGWAMPPSLAEFAPMPYPAAPAPAQTAASLGAGLGTTVQLGIQLVNALLASTANALGGAAAMLPQGHEYHHHGHCGCGGDCGGHCGCGVDCCDVFGCGCCHPGVSGCCR